MKFTCASCWDRGNRDNNEDSFGIDQAEDRLLAVVADGLGGHDNGEVASKAAVDTLLRTLSGRAAEEETLAWGILAADSCVREAADSGHTTIAALWLRDGYGVAAHVGDSRIYQFRDGKLRFQSLDHSEVQMAVRMGLLAPDAVRTHIDRNKLFRVLGDRQEDAKIDSTELTVKPGDRFLICSDGFWEPVTEEDMCRTARETEGPELWLEEMKQILFRARDPEQDNFTAICILAE